MQKVRLAKLANFKYDFLLKLVQCIVGKQCPKGRYDKSIVTVISLHGLKGLAV